MLTTPFALGTAAASHRLGRRLVRHHVGLGAISTLLTYAIYSVVAGDNPVFRLSMATAYSSLVLLGATLAIGPLRVLSGRRLPLSDDLRRDTGFWAALLGVTHVIAGAQVHLGGLIWPYFFFADGEGPRFWRLPFRIDLFGISNYLGLAATLILLMLLALSNDLSMRALGGRWWKRLQQFNYVLFALVAVHGLIYQHIENRDTATVLVLIFSCAVVLALQLAGRRLYLRAQTAAGATR